MKPRVPTNFSYATSCPSPNDWFKENIPHIQRAATYKATTRIRLRRFESATQGHGGAKIGGGVPSWETCTPSHAMCGDISQEEDRRRDEDEDEDEDEEGDEKMNAERERHGAGDTGNDLEGGGGLGDFPCEAAANSCLLRSHSTLGTILLPGGRWLP
ncbi:hypothetical protein BC827DRAFT_1152729 [Russula dissimulans]|nr:hypothetical protein BC827DRAFT_1152729 [Russula dissimulans]